MGGLGYNSIWLLLLCLLGIYGLAATPLFAAADAPPSASGDRGGRRLQNLDGLRGFLALAVVFHHAAIYHGYVLHGTWGEAPSRVFQLLGVFGVRVFFMITGFLFWSQLLRTQGRPAWLKLYTGRVFRIGPLYMSAAFVVLCTVAALTGPHLHEPPQYLAVHTARWLSIGFLDVSDLNGYPQTALLLAGVTWTLRWEWYFYFSLPLLAPFARGLRTQITFLLVAFPLCQLGMRHGPPVTRVAFELARLFLLGMMVASLDRAGWLLRARDSLRSLLFLLLLGGFFYFRQTSLSILALGAMLYLVVSGCTLFGVLTTRPARRLGDISYGIYLLQGLALAAVFRLPILRAPELASPAAHWLMTFAAALLLVGIATAAHAFIEQPGIALGKRVAAALTRHAV